MITKAIIEALVERQANVGNKTLIVRLAEARAKLRPADRLVAIEVNTLGDKLSMVKTEALLDTHAYRVKEVDFQTVCYTIDGLDVETLIYAQAYRLLVLKKK